MTDRSGRGLPVKERDPVHRRRIRAGGVEMAVTESGSAAGVPVVVLHGFTGSAQAMAPIAEPLAAWLPARIVCPDLVGHGRSEVPDDLDLYRVEAVAGQVAALAGALDCETFHLVGYSMGGRVALRLGCTASPRLRSLTLIGATAGIADPEQRRQRAQTDASRAERILADLEAFVDEWMAGPLFAGQAALGETHLQAARDQRLASNPQGLARSLLAGGSGAMEPLHERLADCDTPTLLVVGAHDSKFCAIAELLAAALPRAEIARIDGAGHAAHVERPDTTAAAIAESIAGAEALLAGGVAPLPITVAQTGLTAGAASQSAGEGGSP
ncbi:MAG: alpha/beta fold hydrolase [Acidimicrobiaceae bacterium]|nr:alpha/beta fold hydrolase [Acidimicrobiaceae bacterium]MYE98044.1 alpha/beta fold hydrolase [Acidimicrobiaceae bacterium]MYI53671.1 alpha/beta fold hydrolase [Acidimicrobiaceae bacterium]